MKILILAREEIRNGRLAWVAVLVLGLIPAALPHLPWGAMRGLKDCSGAVASLQIGCALALGGVLGAVMIPGDLAQGRMGFYLTRPVGLPSLMAGRFLGAWCLAAGGALLAGLPDLLLHPAHRFLLGGALLVGALGALPALFAGHLVGLAGFARTPWLLLDVLGLLGFVQGFVFLFQKLAAAGDLRAASWLMEAAFAGLPLLMVLATGMQIARGRANLKKGHRIASLTLATGMALFILGAGLTTAFRLAHPSPGAQGPVQGTSHP